MSIVSTPIQGDQADRGHEISICPRYDLLDNPIYIHHDSGFSNITLDHVEESRPFI